MLIRSFFPDVEEGFYVDVGANHPVEDSVTKIFYDAGWSGMNIEPLKSFAALLNEQRPRDINECVGIAKVEGKMRFREYIGAGRSTFSAALMRQLERDHDEPDIQQYTEYTLSTVRLDALLSKHRVGHIHFLKVDVEGLEYDVLASNDWKRYRPELLCVESNHIVRPWKRFLASMGYRKVFFDGLNTYYLADESMHRREYFDYPRQMLSGPQIIKWTVKREFEEIMAGQKERHEMLARSLNNQLLEARQEIEIMKDRKECKMPEENSGDHL